MRYLLVEDDKELSALIKQGLENSDTKVIPVYDGEAALSKLRQCRTQITNCDLIA